MPLSAPSLRPVDRHRAARVILAWLTGDRVMLDDALVEASDDTAHSGSAALVFALADACCDVAQGTTEDPERDLRRAVQLLAHTDDE